jgi:transcriptional regulator with XRE-family HTH domain
MANGYVGRLPLMAIIQGRKKKMNMGAKIKMLRMAKHYTQDDLGQMCGVTRQMIGKYERDQVISSTEILQKLAEALKVSPDYLLSDDVNNEASTFGDKALRRYFEEIDKMSDKEREHVKFILNAVVKNEKNRL